MQRAFDRVLIAVPDLAQSVRDTQDFFAIQAVAMPTLGEYPRAWIMLENTVLELQQRDVNQASITGLVLLCENAPDVPRWVANSRQLELYQCNGSETAQVRKLQSLLPADLARVDHLVLRTADAQQCVSLFRDTLGLRLALDQTVPEWGGRMLFFRSGKLTLEVICAQEGVPAEDFFWGIAYQCTELSRAVDNLFDRGIETSAIRDGRKAGTKVATAKSHVLGIPTLLVQPASAG